MERQAQKSNLSANQKRHNSHHQPFWIPLIGTLMALLGTINTAYAITPNYPAPALWTSSTYTNQITKSADWPTVADHICTYFYNRTSYTYLEYRTTSPIPDAPQEGTSSSIIHIECHIVGNGINVFGDLWTHPAFLIYRSTQCNDPNATYQGGRCYCHLGYEVNAAQNQCEQPSYTIEFDNHSATLEPTGTTAQNIPTSKTFKVTVKDGTTPKAGINVTLRADVKQGTGGHDHTDTEKRPKGKLGSPQGHTSCDPNALQPQSCIIGKTDDNGEYSLTFYSEEVSGEHTITATCERCGGKQDVAGVTVKVDGLEPIPTSSFYVFGPSSRHGTKNHYLLPAASEKLLLLAINYQSQGRFKVIDPNTNTMVWPESFRVNDASLEWGGRFDIYGDWTNPHKEHMRGVSVDIRANEGTPNTIPPENFYEFGELLKNVIPGGKVARYILECTGDEEDGPQHDRVSENNCVSVLDGSFDDNRHYHIRLMGVK